VLVLCQPTAVSLPACDIEKARLVDVHPDGIHSHDLVSTSVSAHSELAFRGGSPAVPRPCVPTRMVGYIAGAWPWRSKRAGATDDEDRSYRPLELIDELQSSSAITWAIMPPMENP